MEMGTIRTKVSRSHSEIRTFLSLTFCSPNPTYDKDIPETCTFRYNTPYLDFSTHKQDPASINYVKLLHYNSDPSSEITTKSALVITEDGDCLFHEFNSPFRVIIFSCNFCKRTLPVLNIPH